MKNINDVPKRGEHNDFVVFDCEDGTRRTNKLTKTGKHKKNSIRVW